MNTSTSTNQKGFTIIEVVLVLAIAGLIFLMVFLAVPALQRSQRDSQRRSDMSRFVSQIVAYQSNNRGALPGANCTATTAGSVAQFVNNYLTRNDVWQDPTSGATYGCTAFANVGAVGATLPNEGQFQYVLNARCDGENLEGDGARKMAVRTRLEGAGMYCANN